MEMQGTPPEASSLEDAGAGGGGAGGGGILTPAHKAWLEKQPPSKATALEDEHASASCCVNYGGKALDASAAPASAESEKGLAEQAANSTHGATKDDREASSDGSRSLTGESGDNKVASNHHRTWEQYSLPDGGFWWSTTDSTSWFLESSPHPWEKYQVPDSGKCYWWNRDTEEFFVLR